MSRSNNSRRGSKRGNWAHEFWSLRSSESKTTGWTGKDGKKIASKVMRQKNKPKTEDLE